MIHILVAHGARFDAQNKDGKTVADQARERGWIDLAAMLTSA
jgi:hypothetical protein